MTYIANITPVQGNAPFLSNITATSSQILPANNNRKGLYIKNVGGSFSVFIGFSNTADTNSLGLVPGEYIFFKDGIIPVGTINAVTQSAQVTDIIVQEFE